MGSYAEAICGNTNSSISTLFKEFDDMLQVISLSRVSIKHQLHHLLCYESTGFFLAFSNVPEPVTYYLHC